MNRNFKLAAVTATLAMFVAMQPKAASAAATADECDLQAAITCGIYQTARDWDCYVEYLQNGNNDLYQFCLNASSCDYHDCLWDAWCDPTGCTRS